MSTVWLASYPKSGNTWVRALLHSVQFGEPDLTILAATANRDHPPLSTGLSLSDVSDMEALALRRAYWQYLGTVSGSFVLRKSHDAWIPAIDGTPVCSLPDARAIYIVRDPRDVASSWAHHLGVPVSEAVEVMRDDVRQMGAAGAAHPGYRAGSWSTHVTSWLGQDEVPVLLVSYEALLADTHTETARMARWLDMEVDEQAIATAVEACAFDMLAAREIVQGFAEAIDPGRVFFRQGRAGAWRTELEPALVAEIEHDHSVVMRRLGYLPTSA